MSRNYRFGCFLGTILMVIVLVSTVPLSAADSPSSPINLYCGYGPGGPGDVQARAIASALEPILNQSVVVLDRGWGHGECRCSPS